MVNNQSSKTNVNLKKGVFKRGELELYSLLESDIEIIIQYQKALPILQCDIGEEDIKSVDGRSLHGQLGVGRDFSTWIKGRILKYNFIQDVDYSTFPKSGELENTGFKERIEYSLTLDMAKMLAMVENNDLGRLTRKYFLAIEKAFKNRMVWNRERMESIELCKELKRPLHNLNEDLQKYIPDWFNGNTYSWEFNLLNNVIIKMSATEYRRRNGMKATAPIRNTFDEKTLIAVHKLELYDSILLEIEGRLDWEDRKPLLIKYYNSIKGDIKDCD